jgi:para-nitrobenzyl esterase
VVGENSPETLLTYAAALLDASTGVTVESLIPTLTPVMEPSGRSAADTIAVYQRNRPGAAGWGITDAVLSDLVFRIASIRLAEKQSAHNSNTRMYLFAWRTPEFEGRLGAVHSVDVPFVFDKIDEPAGQILVGVNAPQTLATAMHRAWVSFATSGDPGSVDGAQWPTYVEARSTMRFDDRSEVVTDPASEERQLWDGVL